MKSENLIIKPKLDAQKQKIIEMVIDGLPSENSRRAYGRHFAEFFQWHFEQRQPELNKALINRYVKDLRTKKLSSGNINQKLSAKNAL